MALDVKLDQEEVALYEILRNPVLFTEFVMNIDTDDSDELFQLTDYQKEILCDFNHYVSICAARAVGKTVALSSIIIWALCNKIFPGYILYTVPNKVHLEPVFNEVARKFRSNSFLQHFIDKTSGINFAEFKITTKGQATLLCRIAGQSGTGSNLVGLHTPLIIVDEAGYFPYNAFQELQPSLNKWDKGYREIVSGVPTGLRDKNVLYSVDMERDEYTKHRISAFDNPRITEKDIEDFERQYHGRNTDDFIHYVLGQHGNPIFSLFSREAMSIESYPVYQIVYSYNSETGERELLQKILSIPEIPKNYGVVFGIDLGYTEPTAIYVLYLDERDKIRIHAKLRLSKVPYPVQEKTIDALDTRYTPIVIGMDEGSIGRSVRQHLQEDQEYKGKWFSKRIIPVDFSGTIEYMNNIVRTKSFSVDTLQEYILAKRIIFSSTDPDTIDELERMTYEKSKSGEIVYRTLSRGGGRSHPDDHFTSALLCAIYAYHQKINGIAGKRKLVFARWL